MLNSAEHEKKYNLGARAITDPQLFDALLNTYCVYIQIMYIMYILIFLQMIVQEFCGKWRLVSQAPRLQEIMLDSAEHKFPAHKC